MEAEPLTLEDDSLGCRKATWKTVATWIPRTDSFYFLIFSFKRGVSDISFICGPFCNFSPWDGAGKTLPAFEHLQGKILKIF